MSVEVMKELCKSLGLLTMKKEIDDVLKEKAKAPNLSWVIDLLQRELDAKNEGKLRARIKGAKFKLNKSLEHFDWDFNPELNRDELEALKSLDFIRNKEIVLFLGHPGTGKTHLAEGLGLLATIGSYRVICTSMKELVWQIEQGLARDEMNLLFKKILGANLWILDDWGTISMDRKVSEEVFDLLDRRRLSTSLILTSNRAVGEWPEMFKDPILAGAAIDRLFDHASIYTFEGRSYRLEGKRFVNKKLNGK